MESDVIMKDVPNIDGYAVTENGRVWSHKTGKFLSTRVSERGYVVVKVAGKNRYVHRLVAMAFIPNPCGKPTVNHINGVKTDNSVDNLEWATYKEQTDHAFSAGLRTSLTGEGCGASKLSEQDVMDIRRDYVELGLTQEELASKYNLSRSGISLAIRGDNWGHLPVPDGIQALAKARSAEASRRYSPEIVRELRLKHQSGSSIKGLSREYNIPYTIVNYIVNFKTYKDFDKDLQQ